MFQTEVSKKIPLGIIGELATNAVLSAFVGVLNSTNENLNVIGRAVSYEDLTQVEGQDKAIGVKVGGAGTPIGIILNSKNYVQNGLKRVESLPNGTAVEILTKGEVIVPIKDASNVTASIGNFVTVNKTTGALGFEKTDSAEGEQYLKDAIVTLVDEDSGQAVVKLS